MYNKNFLLSTNSLLLFLLQIRISLFLLEQLRHVLSVKYPLVYTVVKLPSREFHLQFGACLVGFLVKAVLVALHVFDLVKEIAKLHFLALGIIALLRTIHDAP